MTAGIDHAHGAAVVVIDADLQDLPELIPELLKQLDAGYDAVYARRLTRGGESWVKNATLYLFYRMMQKMASFRIPEDIGDYRILSRRAADALKQLRECHRFMKGLYARIGYPQKSIPCHRDARFAGKTKWSYWKLWNFALEGITSFPTIPLKIFPYLGLGTAFAAFLFGVISSTIPLFMEIQFEDTRRL